MRKPTYLLILTLSFFMTSLSSAQTYEQYEVQRGDTLGSIAQSRVNISNPVYGPDGKLATLLKMNPQFKSNLDVIYPGQIVNLAQGYYVNPPYEDRRPAAEAKLEITPVIGAEAPAVPAPAVQTPSAQTPTSAPPAIASAPALVAEKPLLLDLGIGFAYSRIDAQDVSNGSKAALVSDLLPEIRVGVKQELAPGWMLNTHAAVRFNRYLAPKADVTLKQPGQTTTFGLGLEKSLSENLRLELQGGVRQNLFARATTNTSYVLDRAPVSYFGLHLDLGIIQRPGFEASVYGNIHALGSSKTTAHDVKSGHAYEVGAHLRRKRRSLFFDQTIFYSNTNQNSNLVNQDSQEMGLTLGVGYEY